MPPWAQPAWPGWEQAEVGRLLRQREELERATGAAGRDASAAQAQADAARAQLRKLAAEVDSARGRLRCSFPPASSCLTSALASPCAAWCTTDVPESASLRSTRGLLGPARGDLMVHMWCRATSQEREEAQASWARDRHSQRDAIQV